MADSKQQRAPPKYIEQLFTNQIANLLDDIIWLNEDELKQCGGIRSILMDDHRLFDHFDIDKARIKYTQQYEWNIDNALYQQFLNLQPRQYIESPSYTYSTGEQDIMFRLRCYAQLSDTCHKCAIFLYLHSIPDNIEGISIEFDLMCEKHKLFKELIPKQWLSPSNRFCGCQAFSSDVLQKNDSITWKIAVKIHDIHYKMDVRISDESAVKLVRRPTIIDILRSHEYDSENDQR